MIGLRTGRGADHHPRARTHRVSKTLSASHQPLRLGCITRPRVKRTIPIILVGVGTAYVAAALWFLKIRLGLAFCLNGRSAADIIRQHWPHRLIQPEWVSTTPDQLMNWHVAETRARLAIVIVLWLLTVGGFAYKLGTHRRNTTPTV